MQNSLQIIKKNIENFIKLQDGENIKNLSNIDGIGSYTNSIN